MDRSGRIKRSIFHFTLRSRWRSSVVTSVLRTCAPSISTTFSCCDALPSCFGSVVVIVDRVIVSGVALGAERLYFRMDSGVTLYRVFFPGIILSVWTASIHCKSDYPRKERRISLDWASRFLFGSSFNASTAYCRALVCLNGGRIEPAFAKALRWCSNSDQSDTFRSEVRGRAPLPKAKIAWRPERV